MTFSGRILQTLCKQNQARTEMKEESADVIKQLDEEMKSGMVKNMELEKMLLAYRGN